MAGSVLKGFGVFLIVVGSLGIVVGLLAAAFGAYVANEEEGRGFSGDREKAEGGVFLGLGGLALAGIGLVLLLLGLLLYAWGASRARAELMQAVARPTPVPVGGPDAPPPRAPAPPVPPAPLGAPKRSGLDWRVPALVVVLAAVVLALLALTQPGGPLVEQPPTPHTLQAEEFRGTVQALRTPLTGESRVTGGPAHEMALPGTGAAVLRGSLNWTASPGSPTLALVLEAQQGGEWREVARGEGGPGLVVESSAVTLQGTVRARVSLAGAAGAASQDYVLALTLIPA